MGLSFDRATTVQATEAKQADSASRRAAAMGLLLDDFDRLRERAWSSCTVVVGTGEGLETIVLDLPPAQDVRAFYNSIATCLDKHLALDRHDRDDGSGLSSVDAWLRGMLSDGKQ